MARVRRVSATVSDYWKSVFFVWLPVGAILWLIHMVFWGEVDLSSYFLAVAVIIISQGIDKEVGYDA